MQPPETPQIFKWGPYFFQKKLAGGEEGKKISNHIHWKKAFKKI
jgi:hypothetical protein